MYKTLNGFARVIRKPRAMGTRPAVEAMARSIPALALAVAFAGAASAMGEESGLVADGREVALKVCAICHAVAEDQARPPTMRPPAPNFAEIAARPNVTEKFLRDFLMKPHGEARSVSAMPAFLMPSREADSVIAYLMSLKGGK
jgi:mono/diheme cytochrome c family protein